MSSEMKSDIPVASFKSIPLVFNQIETIAADLSLRNNIAVFENAQLKLTYQELNERANALARYLLSKKKHPETRVALFFPSSIDYIVSMVAIMKAGFTFMPLSVNVESARLKKYIHNSNVDLLLSTQQQKSSWPFTETELATIDTVMLDDIDLSLYPTGNLQTLIISSQLAYIHNTSGSTGEPKRVLIEHAGILNMANYIIHRMGITAKDHVSWFADISFDAHLCEIFIALAKGATLYIIPREKKLDFPALSQYFTEHQLSVAILTPSVLSKLTPKDFPALRALITTGEAVTPERIKAWTEDKNHPIQFFNGYGPAEVTVATSLAELKSGDEIHIGEPVTGLQIHVLEIVDPSHPHFNAPQKIKPGEKGEIYISGTGVGRGYADEKLSAERFRKIPHPDHPEQTLLVYQTRDEGRMTETNKIQITGRLDRQVKVYGALVCPEEMEAILTATKLISHAYVHIAFNQQTGHPTVTAYIVPEQAKEYDLQEIYQRIVGGMPANLMPNLWAVADNMLFTQSGKSDLKSLTSTTLEKIRIRPEIKNAIANTATTKVATLWRDILNIDETNFTFVEDDHFFQLGATSFQAAELVLRLEKEFKGLKFNLADLYLMPTFGTQVRKAQRTLEEKKEINQCIELSDNAPNTVPLFLIHSLLGEPRIDYQSLLNHWPNKRPIYGIAARISDIATDLDNDLNAIAKDYIQSIKKIRPQGPYLLGGWSSGGLIAATMTHMLRARGETVALFMIDSMSASYQQCLDHAAFAKYLNDMFENKLGEILKLPATLFAEEKSDSQNKQQQIHSFANTLKKAILGSNTNVADRISLVNHIQQLSIALLRYKQKYSLKDVMLWAAEETLKQVKQLGWETEMQFKEIKTFPGNHDITRLPEQEAKILCQQLETFCLSEVKRFDTQEIVNKLSQNTDSLIDTDEQRFYVSVHVYKSLGSQETVDLKDEVDKFLQSNKTVLLITGSGGTGKTMFCQNLAISLKKKPDVITLYFPLGSFEDPTVDLIETKLRRDGLSDAEIKQLFDSKQRLTLIFDGYEESKIGLYQNLYTTNQLWRWNAKVIISCRTSVLADAPHYQIFFRPINNGKVIENGLKEMHISPFSENQIKDYIHKYCSITQTIAKVDLDLDSAEECRWPEEKYHQYLEKLPGVHALVTTPFILKILMEIFPTLAHEYDTSPSKEKLIITITKLYEHFSDQHCKRYENKLLVNGRLPAAGYDIKLDIKRFSQRLAATMAKHNLLQVHYRRKTDSVFEDEKPEASEWDKFFSNENSRMRTAREGSLIRPSTISSSQGTFECWAFVHYSILEFYQSTEIFEQSLKRDLAKLNALHENQPLPDDFELVKDDELIEQDEKRENVNVEEREEKKVKAPVSSSWNPSFTQQIGADNKPKDKKQSEQDEEDEELQKAIQLSMMQGR